MEIRDFLTQRNLCDPAEHAKSVGNKSLTLQRILSPSSHSKDEPALDKSLLTLSRLGSLTVGTRYKSVKML